MLYMKRGDSFETSLGTGIHNRKNVSVAMNTHTGASIHNRFLIKAKAEVVETYSKSTENTCVYKKFLSTKGI